MGEDLWRDVKPGRNPFPRNLEELQQVLLRDMVEFLVNGP